MAFKGFKVMSKSRDTDGIKSVDSAKKKNMTKNARYWRGSIQPVDVESIPIHVSREGGSTHHFCTSIMTSSLNSNNVSQLAFN